MSKSIGSNIRTIIRESINIPTTLLAVTAEVTADVASVTSDAIRGTVPTVKDLGTATGHFAVGVANSELSEEELAEKTAGMSFAQLRAGMATKAGKAGQTTAKFFSEE